MKTTSLASLFVMALVSGCGHFANTEKDFLCGAETGQPCRSMADVDGASLLGAGSVAENPTDTNNKQITEEPLSAGGKMTIVFPKKLAGFGSPLISAQIISFTRVQMSIS